MTELPGMWEEADLEGGETDLTECYAVLSKNPYSVVVLVVSESNGKKNFGFVFTGDSHRWVEFAKETAERLARRQGCEITSWREYGI